MKKNLVILVSFLLLVIILFNVTYDEAYDILDGAIDTVHDVSNNLIGILGIEDFTIVPAVGVEGDGDDSSSGSLGYYEFQGEQISVSWYLINTVLDPTPYNYDTIEYIYPYTFTVTLKVIFTEDKTYHDCIRFTADGVDFLWVQGGFDATSNIYPYIDLYGPMDISGFHQYDGVSVLKYCRNSGLKQNTQTVQEFVQNTLID